MKKFIFAVIAAAALFCTASAYAERSFIYTTDFEGFESGAEPWEGFSFRNDSKTGGIIGAHVDDFHGTSMKLVDLYGSENRTSYTIDGMINLPETIRSGRCVMEFDIYPALRTAAHFSLRAMGAESEGAEVFTLFGLKAKAGGRYETDARYNITLPLGRWSRVQVYCDIDNNTYKTYINGELLRNERSLKISGGLTGVYFNTFSLDEANHGDIYIDNLGIYKTSKAINESPADCKVYVNSDGTAETVFDDSVDPMLINRENISIIPLNGAGAEPNIIEKSYYGFKFTLPQESGRYIISFGNIKGIGGEELLKKAVLFDSAAGVYDKALPDGKMFGAVVNEGTVSVINTAGENGDYVLIAGLYSGGVLQKAMTFTGAASPDKREDIFTVPDADNYEVRAFLIRPGAENILFGTSK